MIWEEREDGEESDGRRGRWEERQTDRRMGRRDTDSELPW